MTPIEGMSSPAFSRSVQQVEIEVDLARVCWADLQFQRDERTQEPVIEEQVDKVVLAPEREAVLSTDEAQKPLPNCRMKSRKRSIRRSSSWLSLMACPTPRNSRS
jgi:hypothetical protein